MNGTEVRLPEKNIVSQMRGKTIYGNVSLFSDNNECIVNVPYSEEKGDLETSSPEFRIDLPLPTGPWVIVCEKYEDESWAIYFNDFPSIGAGSNDSWEEALDSLVEIISDDIRNNEENVSDYQKKRHHFLKKVFEL